MTWLKLDDSFFTHPKAIAAGKDGRLLFIAGLCYCSANLTDGRISKGAAKIVTSTAGVKRQVIGNVVAAGLWSDEGDHYQVHSYLEHQSSREKVEAERQAARDRKQRSRSKSRPGHGVTAEGVTEKSQRDTDNGHARSSREVRGPEVEVETEEPIPPQSSTSTSPRADATPEEEIWTLLARRRAALLQAQDDELRGPRWITTVAHDYAARLEPRRRLLTGQHSDWTVERLADELDPDTSERDWSQPTAEETDEYLAQLDRVAAEAVPMPDAMRAELTAMLAKSPHRRHQETNGA